MRHLTKRSRSQKSEKALAKQMGGTVQIASGAMPVASLKGDVKTRHFLVDDKTTQAKSFSVKLTDWLKIRKQAYGIKRRHPIIHINFEETGVDLFVIGAQTMSILQEKLNES